MTSIKFGNSILLTFVAGTALLLAPGCGSKQSEQAAPPAQSELPANPPPAANQAVPSQPAAPAPAAGQRAGTPSQPRRAESRPPQRAGAQPGTSVLPAEAPRAAAAMPAQQAPAPRPVVVEAGTRVRVRTTSTLSTKTAVNGQNFAGTLAEPIVVDGVTVAGRGANVEGKVIDADKGGRVKGKASISVEITRIQLANGSNAAVETGTYGAVAHSAVKKDATKVGIGAGLGAAIGAIAGGGKGAAIGAAVGGAAGGGTVLATRGEDAVIPAESVLTFTLKAPITYTR